MLKNRSVPANILLPHIAYQSVAEAMVWLGNAFGFVENYRYGDPESPSGGQMHLGEAWIMLRTAATGSLIPRQLGYGTQSLTIFVDDVDAHYRKTKSAGAKIIEEINETMYGELQYGVEDLDGHRWLFAQHIRDVSPDEWGARIAKKV